MTKCKAGYYYCHKDKKCKKIPLGYRVGNGGWLRKEHDNEEKNGNGNGNGSNGNGHSGNNNNGNGNSNGHSNGGNGGVSESNWRKDLGFMR